MRTASLSSALGQLIKALEHLQASWDETEPAWHDRARRTFEEQYLEPLACDTQATISQLRRLSEVVVKAIRECQ